MPQTGKNGSDPFGGAWRTIQHLLADALVAAVFLALVWGGERAMGWLWPNGSDPAFYGIHIHHIWMAAKLAVFAMWLAISTLKLILHWWRD